MSTFLQLLAISVTALSYEASWRGADEASRLLSP
jgi:hypothetical protein